MAQHIVNGLGHFEVKGPDAAALQAFYGAVFGWGFEPKGPGYTLVRTPDGAVDGAIVEAEAAELAIGIVSPISTPRSPRRRRAAAASRCR
jgi:predicted enzyme related to lactoylglutathione lyase